MYRLRTLHHEVPAKEDTSEFNEGLGTRTAIFTPFPQAVPNKPAIDKEHCNYYQKGKCKVCQKFCPTGAIEYDKPDEFITEEIGAVVVTTGFNVLKTDFFPNTAMANTRMSSRTAV